MPIRITLEDLDDGDILHQADLYPGLSFIAPDYVDGEQNVLYVASPADDLGGRIFREPAMLENEDGKVTVDPQEFEELPGEDAMLTELPIAGTAIHIMSTKENYQVKVSMQHVGAIVLLCHPNTQRPLLDVALAEKPKDKNTDSLESGAESSNAASEKPNGQLWDIWESDPFVLTEANLN